MDSRRSDRSSSQDSPTRSAGPDDPTLQVNIPAARTAKSKPSSANRGFTIKFRLIDLVAMSILLAIAATIGVLVFRRHLNLPLPPLGSKVRIAVLPFENLTGDPKQDFVSDGFSEEMISQLGRLNHDQLSVIARTSVMRYKNSNKPVRTIAHELGVKYVLEGSVRTSPSGYRIAAQLIRADDEAPVWSDEYDRPAGDLVSLEEYVARKVADEIQVQLVPQNPAEPHPAHAVNSDAYVYYLQGRFSFNMRAGGSMIDAVNSFDQAIRQDPNFASAYAGLADAYSNLAFYGFAPEAEAVPKAREAALKATQLDDTLAEGHASLGYIYFIWDWDWSAAEHEFQRAIALNDNYAPAHHWYALYLTAMGRRAEALSQIQQAHELDPLSSIVTTASAYLDYFAGRNDEAVAKCESVIEQDPKFMVASTVLGLAREAQGKYPEAISAFRRAIELSANRPATYLDNLGHAYGVSGQRAKAQEILDELSGAAKSGSASEAYSVATLIGLGQKDRALAAMDKNFAKGNLTLVWLKVDPRFDALRADPRYQALLQRGNFPP